MEIERIFRLDGLTMGYIDRMSIERMLLTLDVIMTSKVFEELDKQEQNIWTSPYMKPEDKKKSAASLDLFRKKVEREFLYGKGK